MNLNEKQKDMAKKLGVTAAYLSAVEKDKNNIPAEWHERIIEIYNLDKEEINALNKAIIGSRKNISIEEMNSQDRNFVFSFVQYFSCLNESEKEKIKSLINTLIEEKKNE